MWARASTGKNVKITDKKTPIKKGADLRLGSESFRQSVRIVLDFLGLEGTQGNYRKRPEIDWELLANNIQNPTKLAVVEILTHGTPTGQMILQEIPGVTRAEVLGNLDTKFYSFERWF